MGSVLFENLGELKGHYREVIFKGKKLDLQVTCACYSPDSKYIASGSKDCNVKVWDVKELKCVYTLGAHDKPVTPIFLLPLIYSR